jgi:hypothetical protein
MNLFTYNRVITFYTSFPYLYINLAFYRFLEEIYDGYTIELPTWLHSQWLRVVKQTPFLSKASFNTPFVSSSQLFVQTPYSKINRVLYISSINYNNNRLVSALVTTDISVSHYQFKISSIILQYAWSTLTLMNQLNFLTKLIFLWNFRNNTSSFIYYFQHLNSSIFKKIPSPQIHMLMLHNLKNI